MAQKSSHGSVPAEIDFNFTFLHSRHGDGGMDIGKIDTAFYIEMFQKLRICIRKKRPELWVENLFELHFDNIPSHRVDSAQKFLEKNNMWSMLHLLYSPDLAPCDFFIFQKLKLALKEKHLRDLEGIKLKPAAFLRSIPKSDFKRCYDDC